MSETKGSETIPADWKVAVGLNLYDDEAETLGKHLAQHAEPGSVLEAVLQRLRGAHRERRDEQAKTKRQMDADADQLQMDMRAVRRRMGRPTEEGGSAAER